MTGLLLFAFVGRVSTEDNQEPEASRARQVAKARAILPPGAQIVAEYFDIGDSRSVPWARRPQTGRLLTELRAGTHRWNAIVVGEFARAFGAPIQYSTTYPLLQHFGIELWLPEIGGGVDYSSATTEMLLGMLGGTSKQERDLIRTRVRDGMGVLAEQGERHLGGRPPYGYRLADAGEHPNAKKRALGQRLHRLEPDPVTAPVVGRIFEMFANGQGLKQIANTLTAENIPSPSAHDRKRNPHRDPRGWAHTAIRAILLNERYLGRAVWGKQARTDELLDLDDVAAGYITRQRWTGKDRWVYGPDDAHPALIDRDLWDNVHARLAVRTQQAQKGTRSPKTTDTPYMLRGLVHCGVCERKMQGNQAHGTLRYRCITTQTRSLPAYLADHPKALYVREDAIIQPLDTWLGTIADPEWLAAAQEAEPIIEAQHANLHARLAEVDKATANLVFALEAGTDPAIVNPRLNQLRSEREMVAHQLANLAAPDRLSPNEIDALMTELGGLTQILHKATPPEKASVYQALGLHLVYQPDQNAIVATADLGRVLSRVGGGTLPGSPWVITHDNPRFSSPPATGRAVASLVGSLIWLLLMAEVFATAVLTNDMLLRTVGQHADPGSSRPAPRRPGHDGDSPG
ncbi:MAG: recombinase family protein [Acidimicrobiales bacterium]